MEKEVEDEKEGDGGGLYAGERQTLSSGCRSLSLSRLSLSTLFLFLFLFVPLHISLWPLSLSLPTSFPCFVAVRRRRRRRRCLFLSLSLSLSLSLYLSLSSPTCHRVSPSATRVSLHTPLVLLSIETRGLSLSLARVSLSLSLSLSLASLVPPFPRLSGFLPGLFLLLPAASHPTLFKPRRPRACLSAPARLPRPCSRRRPWCPLFEALLFFLAAFTAPGLHPCPRSIRRGLSVGGGLPPPPAENSSKNIHSTTAGNTSMLVTERVPNVDWKRRRMEREGRLTENE